MKDNGSFESILRKLIKTSEPLTPVEPHKNQQAFRIESLERLDFIPLKFKIPPAVAYKNAAPEVRRHEKPLEKPLLKPLLKPLAKLSEVAKPRPPQIKITKRKICHLNPQQVRALETFHRFGEIKLAVDSSLEEIKRSYRELAKRHHPDFSGNKESQMHFQQIHSAYIELIKGF